jgi:TPR repeat protein
MRHILTALVLGVTILLASGGGGYAQDYQKGLKAYYKDDYATALREWRPLAEQGNAHAQFGLGLMYRLGQGVPQDDKEAVNWFRKSAEQGNALAQDNLGYMYRLSLGVPQDDKEAVNWWRKSAEQGNALAQFNLGLMYRQGLGVPQDDKEAVNWYRKSAEQGNAEAQYFLGGMYNEGQGVPQEDVYAHMWFNIAGSNGYAHAVERRDTIAKRMTKEQLAEAQKLARECVRKNYKDCVSASLLDQFYDWFRPLGRPD